MLGKSALAQLPLAGQLPTIFYGWQNSDSLRFYKRFSQSENVAFFVIPKISLGINGSSERIFYKKLNISTDYALLPPMPVFAEGWRSADDKAAAFRLLNLLDNKQSFLIISNAVQTITDGWNGLDGSRLIRLLKGSDDNQILTQAIIASGGFFYGEQASYRRLNITHDEAQQAFFRQLYPWQNVDERSRVKFLLNRAEFSNPLIVIPIIPPTPYGAVREYDPSVLLRLRPSVDYELNINPPPPPPFQAWGIIHDRDPAAFIKRLLRSDETLAWTSFNIFPAKYALTAMTILSYPTSSSEIDRMLSKTLLEFMTSKTKLK